MNLHYNPSLNSTEQLASPPWISLQDYIKYIVVAIVLVTNELVTIQVQ